MMHNYTNESMRGGADSVVRPVGQTANTAHQQRNRCRILRFRPPVCLSVPQPSCTLVRLWRSTEAPGSHSWDLLGRRAPQHVRERPRRVSHGTLELELMAVMHASRAKRGRARALGRRTGQQRCPNLLWFTGRHHARWPCTRAPGLCLQGEVRVGCGEERGHAACTSPS